MFLRARVCGYTMILSWKWWWPWKGPSALMLRAIICLSWKNMWCNHKSSLTPIFTMETFKDYNFIITYNGKSAWSVQWTLIITNSLGPMKLLCYIEILNFGTKKITLLYRDFVISVFFITRVHCNGLFPEWELGHYFKDKHSWGANL